MRFISDKITFTPAMKLFAVETLEKKLSRLMSIPEDADLKLTRLSNEKIKVDLSVDRFRAQAIAKDFYIAVMDAATKIKAIIIKHNKKDADKTKVKVTAIDTPIDLDKLDLISKEKIFELKPITIREAINELEYTDYIFYVFKNIDDDNNISIVYKRHVDDYGLIKCR